MLGHLAGLPRLPHDDIMLLPFRGGAEYTHQSYTFLVSTEFHDGSEAFDRMLLQDF